MVAGANCCFKGQEINTGRGQNGRLTKDLDPGADLSNTGSRCQQMGTITAAAKPRRQDRGTITNDAFKASKQNRGSLSHEREGRWIVLVQAVPGALLQETPKHPDSQSTSG